MIDAARRITHRLYAMRAPFEFKDALKAAGYRWSSEQKAWWIEGDPEGIDNEAAWLRQIASTIQPKIEKISWFERHS